ncbi:replicative helicase loader/inhibitor [Clostridium sp. MD294]|uniref:replicative helicase loader/inhibitor n=1 Tax=Clostridium sp. MD294 TaxID=97138 RepID=UPI0002CB0E39|nr:replicative helicase loader/inhibitor [Clostridium sp. MD294]NDO45988.1 hypothetical protein [Clostridium sp. MD294]USF30351.1 hypothetical protein C820_001792 [Clostridium sp. MD294]
MTREEIVQVLAVLKANYSGALKDMTRQEAEGKINIWITMFADTDREIMNLAVQKIIATSKYFPTVAEVREVIAEINTGCVLDGGAAWGEVITAIRNYGQYRELQALESMSDMTKTVVQRMGWRDLCLSEDTEIDRAHFLKIYQAEEKRQKQKNVLPLETRQKIEQKQLEYQQQKQELYQQQKQQKLLEQEQQKQKQLQTLLLYAPKPQENDFASVAELFAEKRKELLEKSK